MNDGKTESVDGDETEEKMCPSVSPHGNACMFVAGHKGRHEIQHMIGDEVWDDAGNTALYEDWRR